MTITRVEVTSGVLNASLGGLTIATGEIFAPGVVDTGSNEVSVSGNIFLDGLQFTKNAGPSFGVKGANLVAARTLAISGGTVRIAGIADPGSLPPADALAHYQFDDGGNIGLDTANSYDATPMNQATQSADAAYGSGSLLLDGDGDYIQLPEGTLAGEFGDALTGAASLSIWVKLDNAFPGWDQTGFVDLGTGVGGTHYPGGEPANDADQHAFLTTFRTERAEWVPLDASIARDEWHMVTITQDPVDGWKFYQNAELKYSLPYGGFEIAGFKIGSGYSTGGWYDFQGRMDEAYLFNRPLSPEEVTALFNHVVGSFGVIDSQTTHLDVTGSATLALNTHGTAILGNLTLAAGQTLTATTASDLSVNDATLGSGSTVDTAALTVRGALSVGASPGTTTIAGALTLNATANYHVEIEESLIDRIDVTGDAVVAGTLSVDALKPMNDGGAPTSPVWGDKQLAILTGASVAGEFDSSALVSYGLTGATPADSTGATYLGHGIWFGNETVDDGVYYDTGTVEIGIFQAAPGDTDGDRQVTNADMVNILTASFFGDGPDPAINWRVGDFDGNGEVQNADMVLMLSASLFGDGPYLNNPVAAPVAGGDVKLVVTADGLVIDAGDASINGYILSSQSGILTGDAADNVGLFQEDSDSEISGTFAMTLKGQHALGDVVGETDVDLASDLTLTYTIVGQPGLYTASVVVPEPSTLALLASGLLGLLIWRRRRAV